MVEQTISEGTTKMNENAKWMKWLDVAQTVILCVMIPWATWVTRSVFVSDGRMALVEKWQEQRPKFITPTEADLAIAKSQEAARHERDALFRDIANDLKELLKQQTEMRLQLERHMGKEKTP